MKNLRVAFLYLISGYILPLKMQVEKLLHFKIVFLIVACIIMLLYANPEIKLSDSKQNAVSDKGTMLLIFLMGYVALVVPVIEWAYFKNDTGWTFWTAIGLFLITAGLSYRIYAIRVLGAHFTGVVKQVEGHYLVTCGPYKLIRHPSYLGSLLTFVGCAVLLEAWSGLIVSIVSMLFAYFLRIRAEENLLLHIFGNEYSNYQRKTWKMIPFVW
jgi:protein-S-isoprenylcysteine O-methyltransferase Ste14